jgi:hypothetical protein
MTIICGLERRVKTQVFIIKTKQRFGEVKKG